MNLNPIGDPMGICLMIGLSIAGQMGVRQGVGEAMGVSAAVNPIGEAQLGDEAMSVRQSAVNPIGEPKGGSEANVEGNGDRQKGDGEGEK